MNRLGVSVAVVALAAGSASAAELTRIASSLEPNDPFGLYIDVGYERIQQRAGIAREQHVNGTVDDVTELRYLETDNRMNIAVQLGLWLDLELRFRLPIVFQQDRSWTFAAGTDANSSTVARNCLAPDGTLLSPTCLTDGAGAQPIFNVPNRSYRGGIGNMTFGLAYAIFNQQKDDTKPMWIVGLDWELPTAEVLDPTDPTTSATRGKIGDRTHKFTLFTAFSRRMGPIEPYFRFAWSIPYLGPAFYSNCDNPSVGLSYPENCGTVDWPRTDTGIRMPHVVAVDFGTELIADENPATQQKFAFDVRAMTRYSTEGRYHNELSDVMGKLLATQDYLQLGGRLGLIAKPAQFFSLKAGATFLYETDHTLTDESIGKDSVLDDDKRVAVPQVSGTPAPEVNPNFDFRTDMLSRRFRTVDSFVFVVDVSASFDF